MDRVGFRTISLTVKGHGSSGKIRATFARGSDRPTAESADRQSARPPTPAARPPLPPDRLAPDFRPPSRPLGLRPPDLRPAGRPTRNRQTAKPSARPPARPPGRPASTRDRPTWLSDRPPDARPSDRGPDRPTARPSSRPSGCPSGRPAARPPGLRPWPSDLRLSDRARPSDRPAARPNSDRARPSDYPTSSDRVRPGIPLVASLSDLSVLVPVARLPSQTPLASLAPRTRLGPLGFHDSLGSLKSLVSWHRVLDSVVCASTLPPVTFHAPCSLYPPPPSNISLASVACVVLYFGAPR